MEKETVTVGVAGWAYKEVLDTPVNITNIEKRRAFKVVSR